MGPAISSVRLIKQSAVDVVSIQRSIPLTVGHVKMLVSKVRPVLQENVL